MKKIKYGYNLIKPSKVRTQLSILIQLARIDGQYSRDEWELIEKIGKRYDVDREELDEIERNPDPIGDLRLLSEDQKIELLYNVIRLTKVDRRILPNEILFSQVIASKLGFRRSAVQAMIPLVSDQPLEFINHTSIRRKIGPYL